MEVKHYIRFVFANMDGYDLRMGITVRVKTGDSKVRGHREQIAGRVEEAFKGRLPELRLLCFLDDEDWYILSAILDNRIVAYTKFWVHTSRGESGRTT